MWGSQRNPDQRERFCLMIECFSVNYSLQVRNSRLFMAGNLCYVLSIYLYSMLQYYTFLNKLKCIVRIIQYIH